MSEDRTLSVSRLIDAPVATVWRTAIERLAEWWCRDVKARGTAKKACSLEIAPTRDSSQSRSP